MHPAAWHRNAATRTAATSPDGGSQADFQAIRRGSGSEKAVSGAPAVVFAVGQDNAGDIGCQGIQLAAQAAHGGVHLEGVVRLLVGQVDPDQQAGASEGWWI